MKPFLRSQLERYAQRHGELDFLLSREDIMSDMSQFLKLSREHAEVTVIAGRYARMLQREADEVGGEGTGPDGTRGIPQTDLIILTHDCVEARMDAALAQMQALPTVLAPIVRIRKEELA